MKRFAILLAIAALFCVPAMAKADLFDFSYSGDGVTADGVLTATVTSPGAYLITGITGERNGAPITFFEPGGPAAFYYEDSVIDNVLLVPGAPAFLSSTQNSGFDFGTADGLFNPYYQPNNGTYYEYRLGSGNAPGIPISFNVSADPVPVPPSLLMLAPGLLGLVGIRKRFKA